MNIDKNELEIKLIKEFVKKDKIDRLMSFRVRRRDDFVRSFHTEKYLNLSNAQIVSLNTNIHEHMLKLGASDDCYVVSLIKELDGKVMSLKVALNEIVGTTREAILISTNGKVGYYEGGGYTNRYVLCSKGS